METVVNPDPSFWKGRRVFLTGHTGFKGSWLSVWLQEMGVILRGYALDPPTDPSLFVQADVATGMESLLGDVRDFDALRKAVTEFRPEVVFHLAAQPLVRESYRIPRETYETNFMGTVNVLEAMRAVDSVRSVVVVTTDKVYENKEWHWGYRENDRLGGYDPYSNSKAAAELAVSAYRQSFFNSADYGSQHSVAVASARAGNVIGAGDWALDRLVPDIVRAHLSGVPAAIRNPYSIRPWQHVLEPLSGYVILAEKLFRSPECAEGWNFGPHQTDCITVGSVSRLIAEAFGLEVVEKGVENAPHEAQFLKLETSKAEMKLGWSPRWSVKEAITVTVRGYQELNRSQSIDSLISAIHAYATT